MKMADAQAPTVPAASSLALLTVDLSLAQPRAAASLGSLFAGPPCSTLKVLPKLCLLSGIDWVSLLAALLAVLSRGDLADLADPAPR